MHALSSIIGPEQLTFMVVWLACALAGGALIVFVWERLRRRALTRS